MVKKIAEAPTAKEHAQKKYSFFLNKKWVCPVTEETYQVEGTDLLSAFDGVYEKKGARALPCPCGKGHFIQYFGGFEGYDARYLHVPIEEIST